MEEVKEKYLDILKEEFKVSLENLKVKGVDLGLEALEETAKELSDAYARVAVRTDTKVDDFFVLVKPMLDKTIDNIHDDKK